MKHYVFISYGKRELSSAKSVVVCVEQTFTFINDYLKEAKKKLCQKYGYTENEIHIFDWNYLGTDFSIVE